jgi:hypothetical protein
VSALTVIVHVPVPEQPPPLQPVNCEPAADVAVRETVLPSSYACEHVDGQSIAPLPSVTVPLPVPVVATVSVCWPGGGGGATLNVAVTVSAALIVTVHGLVEPQPPPLQPPNSEFGDGTALSCTVSPSG